MNPHKTLLLLGCLLSPALPAATLHVQPAAHGAACTAHAPCASIQSAVDAARPGDTIAIAAGRYRENVAISADKTRLRIRGAGARATHVIAAGGRASPREAPAGVAADIVFDVFAPGVTLERLSIEHPGGTPKLRDVGVLVRPSADRVTVRHVTLTRSRAGQALEPTNPGSRGVLVLQAQGTVIADNTFSGNYEDAIDIPSNETTVENNRIRGARRIGIVVVQENTTSTATRNVISGNAVERSGADGIQIQGDGNTVTGNRVAGSGGAGIRLCGAEDCVPPGASAVANDNQVSGNALSGNTAGDLVDHGAGNTVR